MPGSHVAVPVFLNSTHAGCTSPAPSVAGIDCAISSAAYVGVGRRRRRRRLRRAGRALGEARRRRGRDLRRRHRPVVAVLGDLGARVVQVPQPLERQHALRAQIAGPARRVVEVHRIRRRIGVRPAVVRSCCRSRRSSCSTSTAMPVSWFELPGTAASEMPQVPVLVPAIEQVLLRDACGTPRSRSASRPCPAASSPAAAFGSRYG